MNVNEYKLKFCRRNNLSNSNISSTCPHNMVNFGALAAEIGWRICGTPANFNGFRELASSLHGCRSTEVNQTLHDIWPSPGGPSIAFSYIISVIARHLSSGREPNCGVIQGMELRNFAPRDFQHIYIFLYLIYIFI